MTEKTNDYCGRAGEAQQQSREKQMKLKNFI